MVPVHTAGKVKCPLSGFPLGILGGRKRSHIGSHTFRKSCVLIFLRALVTPPPPYNDPAQTLLRCSCVISSCYNTQYCANSCLRNYDVGKADCSEVQEKCGFRAALAVGALHIFAASNRLKWVCSIKTPQTRDMVMLLQLLGAM